MFTLKYYSWNLPQATLTSLLTVTFFWVDDVVVSFCLLRDQLLMHAKLLYQHKSNNATMLKP